jgi:hypothetical protein
MGSKSALIVRVGGTPGPRIAVGLVLALFAGVACWPFSDDAALEEMTVKRREGRVVIVRAGETIEVEDETSLQPRDVVHAQSSGEALVRLEGSRLLTLGSESKIQIKDARTVESQSGSVLADTEDPLEVVFGAVRAHTADGTVRVDRGVSAARIASYRGDVTVSAPGEERLQIGSLHEAAPSVNAVPAAAVPYDMDATDEWDRIYLKDVVALQEELDQLAAGLRAQIGNQRPGLDYFSALAGDEDVSFLQPYMGRTPINLLVGFTIASHDDRPLGAAFRQAFSLYERGAKWAVAAAIMDVKLNAVVADLEDIATVAVASGSGGEESFTALAAAEISGGDLTGPPGETDPIPGDPTAPPPTGNPTNPPPSEKPNPPEECQNSVDCIRQDIEDEVQPSPSPTPKPTDDPEDEGPLQILNGGTGLVD